MERIQGLSEMFPEGLRWACSKTASLTCNATKTGWWLVRNALWIASSSAVILALPVLFESERAQQQEEQLQQQRQVKYSLKLNSISTAFLNTFYIC